MNNTGFIETGCDAGLEKEQSHAPLLNDKDALDIVARIQQANAELVDCCQEFAKSIAGQYKDRGLTGDELLAAAERGLKLAARKMDLSRQMTFESYAVWWMRQEILQEIKKSKGS